MLRAVRVQRGSSPFTVKEAAGIAVAKGIKISKTSIRRCFDELVLDTGGLGVEDHGTTKQPIFRFVAPIAKAARPTGQKTQGTKSRSGDMLKKGVLAASGGGTKLLSGEDVPSRATGTKAVASAGEHEKRIDGGRSGTSASLDDGGPPTHPPTPLAAVRPRARSAKQPNVHPDASGVADPMVNCICPPHVDGGTSFRLKVNSKDWSGALGALERQTSDKKNFSRDETLSDASGGTVTGQLIRKKNRLTFVISEQAQIEVFPRAGLIKVTAKSTALWTNGLEDWMLTWLTRAAYFVLGRPCISLDDAYAKGWRVNALELNADFTGLTFANDDAQLFTNSRNNEVIRSKPGYQFGKLESLYIGKRGKHVTAITTHDKTKQIMQGGRGRPPCKPTESIYAETWRKHGWNGVDDVRRVEQRPHGRALSLREKGPGKLTVNLSDPRALLQPELLGEFWVHQATVRTRLVTGRNANGADRKSPTDPRWVAVQQAGGKSNARFERAERERAFGLSHKERTKRAVVKAERALGELVTLLKLETEDKQLELIRDILGSDGFTAAVARTKSSMERPTLAVDSTVSGDNAGA